MAVCGAGCQCSCKYRIDRITMTKNNIEINIYGGKLKEVNNAN